MRTIKERVRAGWSRLPFSKCMPKLVVIRLVKDKVMWMNNFPRAGGVSSTLSPRAIMDGTKLDYNIHCKTEFGQYVQTHEDYQI